MHGDFSRVSYDPARYFASVVYQQGRVDLDADRNENNDLLLHAVRTLAADLLGRAVAPARAAGFYVTTNGTGLTVGVGPGSSPAVGRYYVDGLLCEHEQHEYADQPYPPGIDLPGQAPYWVYLTVWETLVTGAERLDLREPALGEQASETAARSRVAWQVVAAEKLAGNTPPDDREAARKLFDNWAGQRAGLSTGALRAAVEEPDPASGDPCAIPPTSGYRGLENQLYRVEIRQGGRVGPANDGPGGDDGEPSGVTFVWSRENGSVVTRIRSAPGGTTNDSVLVTVDSLGRDRKLAFEVGDMVEYVDAATEGRQAAYADGDVADDLLQVTHVDPAAAELTLEGTVDRPLRTGGLLRRWDHEPELEDDGTVRYGGALPVPNPSSGNPAWIGLELGLRVSFANGRYRPGDYWLIEARTATGDITWPRDTGPVALPPRGVAYHHVPLAVILPGTRIGLRRLVAPVAATDEP
ncbi:DUF6519 domain-containing protein [Actinoplanes sp. CA-030573]|uniref:DUF6519 domain-containing protein n=1 Tax=Actinoplanes sp. CA-030573 TaxID=3239898 RepID=UPI003D8F0CF1